jgi:hypothetical protein
VENSDDSVHMRLETAFKADRRSEVRIELVPPASYLMRHIDEEVVVTATDSLGTWMRGTLECGVGGGE